MKHFSYIIILLSLSIAISCGDNTLNHYAVEASEIDTFLNNESVKDRPHLKIKHAALSRDFMFYGAFIPMLNSPTGHSLKGRIVRFQIFADRLIMLESPVGLSFANGDESLILLAEFPIVRADDDGVVIDFAKGMNSAFTMRNVHSRSVSERTSTNNEQFRAIFLQSSFIRSIDTKDGVMTVSQIAQWRNQKSELVSAEFRYYFREYLPDKDFEKKTFGKQRFVQYFSTPPLVKPPTSTPYAYMSKWDITKPIVFYLSANTPPQYRDAITDGLLFWNHIFGKEVVVVRDLEPQFSAPHPRLNILQWITWDNEPSAYADMVIDHLTGQILQAQIYLRSGWVIESVRKLKNHLEEILLNEQPAENLPAIEEDVPLPAMFDVDDPCFKTMGDFSALADITTHLNQNTISDETLVILTSDILRAVIAHEMGHVLGLRHNLASSTDGNISLKERDAALRSYLQSGKHDLGHDKFFSRSIMDVFSAADDALVGAQIRDLLAREKTASSRLREIFAYDREAIDFGYRGKPMSGNFSFCTDEDINTYLDCRRWDASFTPIQYASNRLNSMMTQIALVLADTFITAVDPERHGGALHVRDIPLVSRNVLKVANLYVNELFLWFDKNSRSAQVERGFAAFGPQNQDQINKEKFRRVREEVDVNGINQTLFAMLPPFRNDQLSVDSITNNFRAHFQLRLAELKSKNPGYRMSDEEQEQAVVTAKAFFENLNNEVIALITGLIGKAHFDDENCQQPIEEALGKIAEELILSTKNAADVTDSSALPDFQYDEKMRQLGALLLNPSLGVWPDWSFDALKKITHELQNTMRKHGINEGSNTINIDSLTREQRQWLIEQNRVLSALTKVRSLSRIVKDGISTETE